MLEPDDKLVQRAVAARPGDMRAFEELVRRHQARVRTNCRYLSGNEEDSLDLAQEVLVKVYFNLKRFEERSSFSTWLNRIKVNHCLNHLRRNQSRTFVDVDEPGTDCEPAMQSPLRADDAVMKADTRHSIGQTLDSLPESLRVPLVLRDMDGFSYQEISEEMGLGLSAVKMRIKRARAMFRTLYTRERGHERREEQA